MAHPNRNSQDAVAAPPMGQARTAPRCCILTVKELEAIKVQQPWNLNNTALKYIRDTHENPRGFPTVRYVDVGSQDIWYIGKLQRSSGEDYTFDPTDKTP